MYRCLLTLLLAASPVSGQSLDAVRAEFQKPSKQYRPWVRWWLPGGDITDAELRREVRILDDAGFGGAEIQAFRIGLKPDLPVATLARINDYPSQSFYRKIRAALEEARSRGLQLDLTLGSGWPFGGGEAITPELATRQLRMIHRSITGPAALHEKPGNVPQAASFSGFLAKMTGVPQDLPAGWTERMKALERVVAVVASRGTAPDTKTEASPPFGLPRTTSLKAGVLDPQSTRILNKRLGPDGTLSWDVPEGNWQLTYFVEESTDTRVIGGAGSGPQLVADHMRREAIQAHLARVGDPAKAVLGEFFGNTLRAVFCDSLEVQAELFWTQGFLDEFQRRRGYDLTPWLPVIEVPGKGDPYSYWRSEPYFEAPGAARVRSDYWRTVSDVWIENFFEPLLQWAHANRLQARIQAHGAPVDVHHVYGLADIPETEQLYAGGAMHFLKAASSAAHQHSRKIVAAEAFVHMGQAYKTTPQSLERDTNTLIAAGINQIVYHGYPYEYMDRPDPGWHPFAAPVPFSDHFNQNTRIWESVPSQNAYISRLQSISQQGRPVVRYARYRPDLEYPNRQDLPDPAGRDYDHISSRVLSASTVRNGKLVTPNGMEYEALILPAEDAAIRKRLPGLKILTKEPDEPEGPTRWQLAGGEFLFYFNAGASGKTYVLAPGHYELWDARTGAIIPHTSGTVALEPGKAQLLLRLP